MRSSTNKVFKVLVHKINDNRVMFRNFKSIERRSPYLIIIVKHIAKYGFGK
jgi:hypothetical protein